MAHSPHRVRPIDPRFAGSEHMQGLELVIDGMLYVGRHDYQSQEPVTVIELPRVEPEMFAKLRAMYMRAGWSYVTFLRSDRNKPMIALATELATPLASVTFYFDLILRGYEKEDVLDDIWVITAVELPEADQETVLSAMNAKYRGRWTRFSAKKVNNTFEYALIRRSTVTAA